MEEDQSFREDFMKNARITLDRCHNPIVRCTNTAIKAHSIQNSKVIDLLHSSGKVYMMTSRLEKNGPAIRLRLEGRNRASTFTGLCSGHDAMLFDPIDNHPIDTSNAQQMFLCAYRSVLRELHVVMEGAARARDMLKTAVDRGVETEECDGPIRKRATSMTIYAYKFYLYKFNQFDEIYRSGEYTKLEYDSFLIDHAHATIAVSSVYFIEPFTSSQYAPIIFNLFPLDDNRSVVSFCYSQEHASRCRASLGRILQSAGEHRNYELSRLVIANTENFILSPKLVSTWAPEKIKAIEDAFNLTTGPMIEIGESPHFMLF
ncbi:hypothetical protein [Methylobacterium sp. Leaf125]|uniref:hypothetical protein n=1 Tax=Methylobacterium sp. Leaf125 TaxID=1736265 RepID=UPI000AFE2061|nr:hypothetical protein [Methylobacterium sp. Leaf125]